MPDLPKDFSERLLAREEVDAMRLEQLRQQIDAVLEVRLTRLGRVASVAGGAVWIVFCLAFIPAVARGWADMPFLGRAFVIVGLGGHTMMSLVLIAVGLRGVYERRRHNAMYIGIALLMCIGLGAALVHDGWSAADGRTVFAGTVLLVLGGGVFVMHVLEQYHLTTKRKLLELELRMAELAERLERGRSAG